MKTGLLVAADLYGCAEDSLAQEALTHVLEERAKENHMQVQSIRTEQENETEYGIYSICKVLSYMLITKKGLWPSTVFPAMKRPIRKRWFGSFAVSLHPIK